MCGSLADEGDRSAPARSPRAAVRLCRGPGSAVAGKFTSVADLLANVRGVLATGALPLLPGQRLRRILRLRP